MGRWGVAEDKATEESDKGKWSGTLSRWSLVVAVVFGCLAIGFAASLLISTQNSVGSAHRRNFHNIEVAAHGLETWPESVRQIAHNRLTEPVSDKTTGSTRLDHPDLGRYVIAYADGCGVSDKPATMPALRTKGAQPASGALSTLPAASEVPRPSRVFVPGISPGETMQYSISQCDPGSGKTFSTKVALDRLVDLDRAAPEFSHFLILAGDGSIIAQLGNSNLPINHISEFSPTDTLARDLAARTLGSLTSGSTSAATPASTPGSVALDAVRGVVEVTVGGDSYQAYVKPFVIPGERDACPPAAPQSAADYSHCYAVGLMPTSTLRQAWLSPPPVVIVGFGLALLALVAALPLVRLLLIGGAESITPLEAIAAVLGVQGLTAMATLAILFAGQTMSERATAEHEAQSLATTMATTASTEIEAALAQAMIYANAQESAGPSCAAQAENNPDKGSIKTCPSGSATMLPSVDSLHFANDTEFISNPLPIAFHANVPASIDPSNRQYFRDLQQGRTMARTVAPEAVTARGFAFAALKFDRCRAWNTDPKVGLELHYTMEEIRAQTDGTDKTVLAIDCATAPGAPLHLLAATELRSFLTPVLPFPQSFTVIDLGRPGLPVVFHQQRDRAGTENFADQVDTAPEAMEALHRLAGERAPSRTQPLGFSGYYDGHATRFAAVPIAGTDWAVIVFHPLDAVDAIAARAVSRTIIDWGAFAVFAMFVGTIAYAFHPRNWRNLWPSEPAKDEESKYHALRRPLAAIGATGLIAVALDPILGLCVALPGWAVAVAIVSWPPKPEEKASTKPLSPSTQRLCRQVIALLLICVAVVPISAFWRDAEAFSHVQHDDRRASAAAGALVARHDTTRALQRLFELPESPLSLNVPDPGLPLAGTGRIEAPRALPTSMGHTSWAMQFGLPDFSFGTCASPEGPEIWLCLPTSAAADRQTLSSRIGVVPSRTTFPPSPTVALLILLATGVFGFIIYAAISLGLRALTGFGIPLGAVQWPQLNLDDGAKPEKRLLLIAPQQAVRDRLNTFGSGLPWKVDLADLLLGTADGDLNDTAIKKQFYAKLTSEIRIRAQASLPLRLVTSGIALVLRDPARRRAALKFLETADRALNDEKLASLTIVSELSPLERILDAFEAETDDDKSTQTTREELRWSRLFQNFSTIMFGPIDKVDMGNLAIAPLGQKGASDNHRAIWTLIEEMRWLPGSIIECTIGERPPPYDPKAGNTRFPLSRAYYQDRYTGPVLSWANKVNPVSAAAAIDFLRSNAIEHYEQLWAASTHGERLVLEAISRGNFVNMRTAIAMQSLVRRGLVILDPAPRLMNRSFALFVRQAERPGTLQRWRDKQPRSNWSFIRWPVFFALPVAIIGVTVAAAESGQQLTAIFSLLAAGAPALLSTLFKAARPAT